MIYRRDFFLIRVVFNLLVLGWLFLLLLAQSSYAAAPTVLGYQGRLTDLAGNPLGGKGTIYFFKFSIWENENIKFGNRLWPANAPQPVALVVENGNFDVNIGDYNFSQNQAVYLQIEVSSDNINFQTLSPRQPILVTETKKIIIEDPRFELLTSQIQQLGKTQQESASELFRTMALLSQGTDFGPRGNVPLTISNPIIQGDVRGLDDGDIPDDITASRYLSLSGGSVTGNLTVGGDLAVSGSQTADSLTIGELKVGNLAATSTPSGFGTSSPYAALSVEIQPDSKLPAFVVSDEGTSTPALAVNSAGQVLIGTSSPSCPNCTINDKLHIDGDFNGNLRILVTNPNGGPLARSTLAFGKGDNNVLQLSYGNEGQPGTALSLMPKSGVLVAANAADNGLIFLTQAPTAPILFGTGGVSFSNERLRITGTGDIGIATTSPGLKLEVGGFANIKGNLSVEGNIKTGSFIATSSVPFAFANAAYLQIAAGDNALRIATTTLEDNIGHHPLLLVSATTTGNQNYARVAIGTTTSEGPAGLLDQLYVAGRINSSWNMYWQDFLGRNNIGQLIADAAVHGLVFDEDSGNSGGWDVTWVIGAGGVAILDNPTSPNPGEGEWFGTGGINVVSAYLNPVFETRIRSTANLDHRAVAGFLNISLGADAGANPTDGIYFRKSFADTTWQAVTSSGGNETVSDTGVPTSDFETLRIEVIGFKEVRFIVNGYVKVAHDTNITATEMGFYVGNELIGTVNRATAIDYLRVWTDDPSTAPLGETIAQVVQQNDITQPDSSEPINLDNARSAVTDSAVTAANANLLTILPGGEIKVPDGANEISGSGKIAAGTNETFISNNKIVSGSKIFLTPLVPIRLPLSITEKRSGEGFRVAIAETAANDIDFDWLIISGYSENTSSAAETPATEQTITEIIPPPIPESPPAEASESNKVTPAEPSEPVPESPTTP